MPAQQTSVSNRMAVAFPGMASDASRDTNNRSYVNEEASAEIPFGVFVGQGAGVDGALKLAATTDTVIGAVMHSHAYAKDQELGTTGLKPDVTLIVASRMRGWICAESAALTPLSRVFIRCVAAGAEVAGAVRGDADTADAVDASAYARFVGNSVASSLSPTGFMAEVEWDIAASQ